MNWTAGFLFGWLFWTGISLGSLAWLCIHHLTDGRWSAALRPTLAAAARTLPLSLPLALLWLPGISHLYPWADAARVAGDHVLQHRQVLFTPAFVAGRTGVFLLIWSGLAWLLARPRRQQSLAAPALLFHLLAGSMLAFDLVMSLEPHFSSSVFGLILLLGQALSALCLSVFFTRPADDKVCHDWGSLMLANLMLQAYTVFSQLVIVWMGDLPQEIPWLQSRVWGAWQPMALALFLLGGIGPFLFGLAGPLKRRYPLLRAEAVWLLLALSAHLYWLMWPALSPDAAVFDLAAPAGWLVCGAIWLVCFLALRRLN